jgi:hypothetical protein
VRDTVLSPSAATVKKALVVQPTPLAFADAHHAEARLQQHVLRGVCLLTRGGF